ncbi:MAG: sel1 repeat family protein, partial [Bacteriovoracaceae bacterium]|nr:sel1 repeat family protein [Bacteriovoracaceae bacterium]
LQGEKKFSLFEPAHLNETKAALNFEVDDVLIKFMVHKLDKNGFKNNMFDRNVVIVRDPRDFVVSSLLYRFNSPNVVKDEKLYSSLYDAFLRKERDPSSISCIDLLRMFNKSAPSLLRKNIQEMQASIKALSKTKNVFVYKYEDMIDGKYSSLESYLGCSIVKVPEPDGWTSKIARSKGYGDWKNWFTNKDIAYFGQSVEGFLHDFVYDEDWDLNTELSISSSSCSEYITRLKSRVLRDPLYKTTELSPEYIEGLHSAVDDGKNVAMHKLAMLYLDGSDYLKQDFDKAMSLFDLSSKLGNHNSTIQLGDLFLSNSKFKDLGRARSIYRRGAIDNNISCVKRIVEVVSLQDDQQALLKWNKILSNII